MIKNVCKQLGDFVVIHIEGFPGTGKQAVVDLLQSEVNKEPGLTMTVDHQEWQNTDVCVIKRVG